MRKVKEIVSFLLSSILMITFICFALFIVTRYSLLSVDGIMRSCDESQYFKKLQEEIIEQAYYEGIPFGIDKQCVETVFSEDLIRLNMKNTLNAQVGKKKNLIQLDEITSGIKTNVIEEYKEIDKSEEAALDTYIANVCKLYKEKMKLPGHMYLSKLIRLFAQVAKIGIFICIMIFVFCAVVLIAIRRYGHHGLRFVAYGALAAGSTLSAFSVAIILSGIIKGFDISSELLNELFIVHLTHQLYMMLFAGVVLLLIGFLTIWIVSKQRKRLIR